MAADPIRAVLWDVGGVLLASPFEAFNRYEVSAGLPRDLIRTLNATNSDTNAWARFERSEVSFAEFCDLFQAEARAAGHQVDARHVVRLLHGEIRPQMVEAVRRCRAHGFKTAMLTNNVVRADGGGAPTPLAGLADLFDCTIESSKVGVRKPDRRFYEIACDLLEVRPHEAVFLDDLGVNLKPARALGMTTIKVSDPDLAIKELEDILGVSLRQ